MSARTRRRVMLLLSGMAIAPTLALGSPVPSGAFEDRVTVPTDVEAWYVTTPVDTTGLPPVNPYPPDTLHVGVTGGTEDSRTYLTLDLSSLPPDATIDGGTLTLPLDPDGGTRDAAAADVVACLTPDPGPEAQGSLEPPPDTDCSTRSDVVHVDGDPSALEVDLAPFGDALRAGGLALMPDPDGEAPALSWHVAFYGRDHAGENAVAISATLVLDIPTSSTTTPAPPAIDTGTGSGGVFSPPGAAPSPGVAFPPAQPPSISLSDPGTPGQLPSDDSPGPDEQASAESPRLGGDPTPDIAASPAAFVDASGISQSVVFALPFALVAFVWYFGSALTRERPSV